MSGGERLLYPFSAVSGRLTQIQGFEHFQVPTRRMKRASTPGCLNASVQVRAHPGVVNTSNHFGGKGPTYSVLVPKPLKWGEKNTIDVHLVDGLFIDDLKIGKYVCGRDAFSAAAS